MAAARYYGGYYPPSTPLEAKGGIKAQTKRGTFGRSWWAKRWIAVLESFNIGARLGRGRNYARKGQVISVDVQSGLVEARVQGSRSRPYEVVVKVKKLSAAQWKKIAEELSSQAIYSAKLLAGEMPQDIEEAFRDVGLSLFPEKSGDLRTACSCPDWSNPCKHIAAVYYLLGEEFDRDPFLIFKLRGMSRKKIVEMLGVSGATESRDKSNSKYVGEEPTDLQPVPPDPIPEDPNAFWNGNVVPDDLLGEVIVPSISAALIKRLGNFPFWRGATGLVSALEPIYLSASEVGLEAFLGYETKRGGRECTHKI